MNNLDFTFNIAVIQIAFALGVIAFVVVLVFFAKFPDNPSKKHH